MKHRTVRVEGDKNKERDEDRVEKETGIERGRSRGRGVERENKDRGRRKMGKINS